MAKKKTKGEEGEWIGVVEVASRIEVLVRAKTEDEAIAKADAGDYEQIREIERHDWSVKSMEENR